MKNFYKNKNILVTGGTGTIGIPLVKLLIKEGANVHVVSMDSKEYAKEVLPEECHFYRGDLTYIGYAREMMKNIEHVFDMSGVKGSIGSNDGNLSKMFVSFLKLQTGIMHEAYLAGVNRYLFMGSICSYPKMLIPKKETDMWNELPQQNDKYGGMAKRVGELQAESYFADKVWDGIRIIRPSNVYGPYDDFDPKTAQVIPALINRAVNGENPLTVWGNGDAVRDFVYSDDVAYWAMVALEKLPPVYPVNIGSGEVIFIKEIARDICNYLDIEFTFDENKPSGDSIRRLSIVRAEKELSYEIFTPLTTGIENTIEWYKDNKDLAKLKKRYYNE